MSDFGIAILSKFTEDSFDKYYNKELDLDEGKINSSIFRGSP